MGNFLSSNKWSVFTCRWNVTVVTVNFLLIVTANLYTLFACLPSFFVFYWSADSSARQWESDCGWWLCFSINTTGECTHCACDCKSADNWFKKDLFPIMSAKPGVWCYLPPILSHLFQHLLQTFSGILLQIELNDYRCHGVSFFWGNEYSVCLLL